MEPYVLILLGMIVVGGGISMFQAQRKVERSRSRDIVGEAQSELQATRESVLGQVRQLEVRLLEHSRELEAQLATRIALLDQLVSEADERIATLRNDLDASSASRDRQTQHTERRAA